MAAAPSATSSSNNSLSSVDAIYGISGGGSSILDFLASGTSGSGDTFLHFVAPGGETITSLTVAYLDDNGQRRPVMDDLGFIVASPTPPNTFSNWISSPAFGLNVADQDFEDDPDLDGIANGLEAFFGTHPGQFTTGLTGLAVDGTVTTFSHPQNENIPSDISGFYEWSPNLVDWYAGDGVEGPPSGPTLSIVPTTVGSTTTATGTASTSMPRLFLRAGVLQN